MTAGLTDRIDCVRLAEEGASLDRDYPLAALPRLQDLLAQNAGAAHATFAFRKVADRAAARVSIKATLRLTCQRCLKDFAFPVRGNSKIEFADEVNAEPTDPENEIYVTDHGMISLQDLAEEELLLAVPVVPTHASEEACGINVQATAAKSRPFAALQDLMKKT